MKVVIEAGSTKTDAAIINDSHQVVQKMVHTGLNPVTDIDFNVHLSELIDQLKTLSITSLYYYGSGCINENINDQIKNSFLEKLSTLEHIEVDDDMLAAARATMKKEKGVACIIGTGSNAASYDGRKLVHRSASGGYLLGDEGSGFRIGQQVYLYYVRGWLNERDRSLTVERIGKDIVSPVKHLYEQRNPRTYLASFASLLPEFDKAIRDKILDEVMGQLVEKMIKPLISPEYSVVHFVGSIAFYFQNEIRQKLEEHGISSGFFVKNPIDELISYHL